VCRVRGCGPHRPRAGSSREVPGTQEVPEKCPATEQVVAGNRSSKLKDGCVVVLFAKAYFLGLWRTSDGVHTLLPYLHSGYAVARVPHTQIRVLHHPSHSCRDRRSE
jgi:hypothetical protein